MRHSIPTGLESSLYYLQRIMIIISLSNNIPALGWATSIPIKHEKILSNSSADEIWIYKYKYIYIYIYIKYAAHVTFAFSFVLIDQLLLHFPNKLAWEHLLFHFVNWNFSVINVMWIEVSFLSVKRSLFADD